MRPIRRCAVRLALFITSLTTIAPTSTAQAPDSARAPASVQSEKSPGVAWLLSFLIVGGGQAYNGQWGKAVAFFGGAIVGGAIASGGFQADRGDGGHPIGGVLWLGSWIWSQIDAPITASAINRKRRGLSQLDFRPQVQALTRGPTALAYGPTWGIVVVSLRF